MIAIDALDVWIRLLRSCCERLTLRVVQTVFSFDYGAIEARL
jgi:hypothetical protein